MLVIVLVVAGVTGLVGAAMAAASRVGTSRRPASTSVGAVRILPATPSPSASPRARPKHTSKPARQPVAVQPIVRAAETPPTIPATAGPHLPPVKVSAPHLLRNLKTHFCADLPGKDPAPLDSPVLQFYCHPGNSDNQEFEFVSRGNQFLIKNVKSGFCLDVPDFGSVAISTPVAVHTCVLGAGDNQMFEKVAMGKGFFLRNVKSGLCLDVNDDDTLPSQILDLFPCSRYDDHIWTLA